MTPDQRRAHAALSFVIPEIEKRSLPWVITGGFACYAYGVPRKLTDIDIDIGTSKDSDTFKDLILFLDPHIIQPLERLLDQNYDNYNFEIAIDGQIVDICPMAELKIFDKHLDAYVPFYGGNFPRIETVDFFGLALNLLAKDLIVKNKEMLRWQRDSDLQDIVGLQELMKPRSDLDKARKGET